MKICAYCGSEADKTTVQCPHCGSGEFKYECDDCGAAFTGVACPVCGLSRFEEDKPSGLRTEASAAPEAQHFRKPLWGIILTVLLPFIGGWVLLLGNYSRGVKKFAQIYCLFMAVSMLFYRPEDATWPTAICGMLLCLLPVLVFTVKQRKS